MEEVRTAWESGLELSSPSTVIELEDVAAYGLVREGLSSPSQRYAVYNNISRCMLSTIT